MDFPTRDLCMEIVRKNFMQSQVAASRVLRALDGCSEASGLHSDRKPWFSITDLHSESWYNVHRCMFLAVDVVDIGKECPRCSPFTKTNRFKFTQMTQITQIITIKIYQVYPEEYGGLLREIDGAALAPAVDEDAWQGEPGEPGKV